MPEIKNNFLGSKMNRDIDDRLMPNNEYRYALNLEINKSQSSDVGTLQNILGNILAVDFNAIAETTGLECIGVLTDDSNNNIYVFLTNYSGTLYNKDAENYIYVYNNLQNTTTLLVSGAFLNFSTQFPIYGVNLVENLLFWTDNRNQPRKINVQRAFTNINYYTTEDQISVAKLSPLYTPELFRESELAPGEYETTMYDVVSPELPNGVANPYLIDPYPGDPAYLESRYVRFSYRYKFEDGEYSIMAPFTQIAYIPKQDGYFLYNTTPAVNDEESAYRSTIVSFMQNKVNNILLQIILPGPADEINSLYKITEIEILYKESDAIAISVVDSIPTIPRTLLPGESYFWNTDALVYSYNYQSKKPFKTLPQRDTIRVNDITPVKALSQEVVGNRVIYGNYQDKLSYPKYLEYNVGYSQKFEFGFLENQGTSVVEYPNHSIKQNRNYQVGVVLCDKFGRQSGVILSDLIESGTSGGSSFGASSLYVPYSLAGILPSTWPGDSLKILFNKTISPAGPDVETGWPGLYNGDSTSTSYNPLGWYAYKIVVKQTEQEYYNVYLPGVMAAYPEDETLELGKTSHTVLINDNINKVPRDLSEVGPAQKQFRSSVILYPRVNNNNLAYNNEQYYPGNTYAFASTIATNNSLFFPNGNFPTVSPDPGYLQFYQIDSDPLIARLSTVEELGVTSDLSVINLAVYETKPVESKLDIYWETSTAGLISELNTAILTGSGPDNLASLSGWTFSLSEAAAPGTNVSGDGFTFKNVLGDDVTPSGVEILSVITLTGANVTSKFVVDTTDAPTYKIKTAPGAYFYYGFNASNAESYIFTIRATIGSPETSETFIQPIASLTNVLPTIDEDPTIPNPISLGAGTIDVYQFYGVNGSNVDGPNSTLDLTWSVTGNSMFTITSSGLLQELSGAAQGTFNLRVTLTEASGGTDFVDIVVVYPIINGLIDISNQNTFTINNVIVGGEPVDLNTGFIFPVGLGSTVKGTYIIPTGSTTVEVDTSSFDAALQLCVGDVCYCESTSFGSGYVVFPGLDLSAGLPLSIILGSEFTACPL